MKAIVVTPGKKNSAKLIDIEKPKLNEDQVLIKTIEVGIDGTDREINSALYGITPLGSDFLVLGHEALGEIVQIGGKVDFKGQPLEIGDIIVPLVRRPDDCSYCMVDEQDMCIKGEYTERGIKGQHGFMSEFFTEFPKYLVKIPDSLKYIAILLEPLSVVEKGIRQAYKIQKRMSWAPKVSFVLGLGPIGLLASIILKLLGLRVVVYSLNPETDEIVQLIKSIGIEYIHAKTSIYEVPALIEENIDIIFEATGNSIVAFNAISALGTNGVLILTGVTGGHKTLEICTDCLNIDIVLKNKTTVGTVNANIIDFQKGVEDLKLLNSKYPDFLKNIRIDRIDAENFKEGFENFKELKAVLVFDKG